MADLKLRTVTRRNGNNDALIDGVVKPRSFEVEMVDVPVLVDAFRRMVRGLEFDMCEMAITTYIAARAYKKPFTAIPTFLVRQFHHGAIMVNTKIVKNPKDLEGKRVGVNRGYTVTTGVWVRGVLESQYGVDLKKITWVLSGDEHVAEYKAPSNVVPMEAGKKMGEMLASGELAGAIGAETDSPDVKPLIANAQDVGLQALRTSGHYPINHLVVIKDELLAAHPELAVDAFNAFSDSKKIYVDKLKNGKIEKLSDVDKLHLRVMEIMPDPLPFGIEPNRKALEELMRHVVSQGIITTPMKIEDLFTPSTRTLVG